MRLRHYSARTEVAHIAWIRRFILSVATHLLDDGCDIRSVQELLGHRDVSTTMTHAYVLNQGPSAVRSPLDPLATIRKGRK